MRYHILLRKIFSSAENTASKKFVTTEVFVMKYDDKHKEAL